MLSQPYVNSLHIVGGWRSVAKQQISVFSTVDILLSAYKSIVSSPRKWNKLCYYCLLAHNHLFVKKETLEEAVSKLIAETEKGGNSLPN